MRSSIAVEEVEESASSRAAIVSSELGVAKSISFKELSFSGIPLAFDIILF